MRIPTVIRIKKRRPSGWLIWLLVMMPFALALLPHGARYLLDPVWMALLVLTVRFGGPLPKGTLRWVAGLGTVLLLTSLPKSESILYLLWGFRNNFRLYAAFFAFCAFLTPEEGEGYLNKIRFLFRLNIPVTLVQYFLLGKAGDYLGGIFGTGQGCNAYTNLFFCIVVTRSLVRFLEGEEPGRECLKTCFWSLFLAALAELKFFFLEFAVISVLAVCFSGFSRRKLWVLLGAGVGIVSGAALLSALFPTFRGWFSLSWLLDAAGSSRGYTSSGDLNRLNCIGRINLWFFRAPAQRFFGLGLGNCETSGFSFLNTPFYRAYGRIHYTWMSTSFWYLECGWVGLLFFFGFFVLVYLAASRLESARSGMEKQHCRMAQILAAVSCMVGIYNASLRTEAAYMIYFALALPFLQRRRTK